MLTLKSVKQMKMSAKCTIIWNGLKCFNCIRTQSST